MRFFRKRWRAYKLGKSILEHPIYNDSIKLDQEERKKSPNRTEIINFLLSTFEQETTYLEIGVRNPDDNYNHIKASKKYGVDPGLAFKKNPVEFKMTSDELFEKIKTGKLLDPKIKFHVVFIDGLHLAEQVERDIENALQYVHEDGFVVLHDCNPPTEWHSREGYDYFMTPARASWNGTAWKAFYNWRTNPSVFSCCIDTDWGVGILSTKHRLGESIERVNPFYEFQTLNNDRKKQLNLISFDQLKSIVRKN